MAVHFAGRCGAGGLLPFSGALGGCEALVPIRRTDALPGGQLGALAPWCWASGGRPYGSSLPLLPLLIRSSRKGGAYQAVNNTLIKAHEKSPSSVNHTRGACAAGRGTFPTTSALQCAEQLCFAPLENWCGWPGGLASHPSPFLLQHLLLAFAAFSNQFPGFTGARAPSRTCNGLTGKGKTPPPAPTPTPPAGQEAAPGLGWCRRK